MRCFPAAVFCCLLLLFAAASDADAPASGTLPVTVRTRDGKSLVGIRLTLTPFSRVTMTDAGGAAKFTNLAPGTYTVSMTPAGYYPLSIPVTLAANGTSSLEVVLEKGGASAVTTQDAAGRHFLVTVPPVPRPVNPPPEYLLTPPVPPGSGPAWRTAQEAALREATFRYLFSASAQYDTQRFPVHYISVQGFPWEQGTKSGEDPDAPLLGRFRGSMPPVQPVSMLLAADKDWHKYPRHNWIIYCVSSFHWISDTAVEINAAKSLPGCFGGESIRLTCTLRNGWWETTGFVSASA